MGERLNPSGDKVPEKTMYEACRVFSRYVKWNGGVSWDFSALHSGRIDPEFKRLINTYLEDVLRSERVCKGWKIPETTLCYPWILRMFPDLKYIHWVRDPRDCILGAHVTDDLSQFNIPHPTCDDIREKRAISWCYQYELIRQSPEPNQFIRVRFEDFVLRQEQALTRLEGFLGVPLAIGRSMSHPPALRDVSTAVFRNASPCRTKSSGSGQTLWNMPRDQAKSSPE